MIEQNNADHFSINGYGELMLFGQQVPCDLKSVIDRKQLRSVYRELAGHAESYIETIEEVWFEETGEEMGR